MHKLGHYVAGEVHNVVGHFVVGTKCLLTAFFYVQFYMNFKKNASFSKVHIVDSFDFRDEVLDSSLGAHDGWVYHRL